MEVHKRIENITNIISAFKIEQERLLLNTTEDFKIKTTLKSISNNNTYNISNPLEGNESMITKILNVECILMPNSKLTKSLTKFWPQALILNRAKNRAEIGLIESYGSLWRLIPFKETIPGTRVVLETAEIGEVPRYIGYNLDIVDSKVDAAVWSINVVSSEQTNDESQKGLIIQLVCIDLNISSSNSGRQQQQILVCEASKDLSNYCELSISNISPIYQNNVIQQGLTAFTSTNYPIIRTVEWEVIPEAWISNDVEFLDKFTS